MTDSGDDLFRAAKACAKSGNHEESISLYRQYVELRPQVPVAWSSLAYHLVALCDWDGAIAALKEALRLKPDYASAHALYGFALERKGEVTAAIAQYRAAIAAGLVDVRVFEYLARLHVGRGELKEAERVAREGRRSWPKALVMRRVLADILVKRKRWREASAEYEAIAAKCPGDHDAVARWGWARDVAGDLQGARAGYERALGLRPDSPETLVRLGGLLRRLGKLDAAEAAYRQAIDVSPGYVSARIWLASLLGHRWEVSRSEDHLQAARREIEVALAMAPDTDAAILLLSHIEWQDGNRARSIQVLEDAARRRPDLPEYHYLLVHRSLRRRRFRRAWEAWRAFQRVAKKPWDRNAVWNALPPPPSPQPDAESPLVVAQAAGASSNETIPSNDEAPP
ncbi:MAG TPA: tetratricopeptide repeat protein [Armatimonadota bacterium]|nr:tetratricopeptide repeat protein [Armatimonadota bacterium]